MDASRFPLTRISLKLSTKELELLRSLASDQLFRREFIDCRIPGSSSNRADLTLGKELVARLQSAADRARKMEPDGNAEGSRGALIRQSGSSRRSGKDHKTA